MFSQEQAMDHKEPEGPAKQEDDGLQIESNLSKSRRS